MVNCQNGEMVKCSNGVMSLSSAPSLCCCRHLQVLIVVIGILLLAAASRRHRCIVHGSGVVPPLEWFRWLRHLVDVVVVRVSLLSLAF